MITRQDIASEISKATGVDVKTTKAVVDSFIETLSNAFVEKQSAQFRGFGTFEYREAKSRKGRNIKLGTMVDVPRRGVIRFKLAKELKDKLILE